MDGGGTYESCKNAIEYSPKDSEIEIDSGGNPLYSWISVKDSGAGMSREQYAALFKRFEYSTNENGFGIGMPLALSIVKGQGGDIDIDFGNYGCGTTFIIKFLSDRIVIIDFGFVTEQSFYIVKISSEKGG